MVISIEKSDPFASGPMESDVPCYGNAAVLYPNETPVMSSHQRCKISHIFFGSIVNNNQIDYGIKLLNRTRNGVLG
jgi:hypothetical protein